MKVKPLAEHPKFSRMRNRRMRRRLLKLYYRMGITTYIEPDYATENTKKISRKRTLAST